MNYAANHDGTERTYLDSGYLDFLIDAGFVVFPIAVTENVAQLNATLDRLDGILFTGGLDLDPSLWGQPRHPQTQLLHPRRQRFEFMLYEAVQKRRLPVMGICLGIQMINIAHGGSLYQHLPDSPGQIDHGQETRSTEHEVVLDKSGKLYGWLKQERVMVPSCHHQAVDRVGDGLLASAVTDDGVTEAIERPDYPFLVAVQWHPERDRNNRINKIILEQFFAAAVS